MADLYINLNYGEYKHVEQQMADLAETEHGKGTDFYHKSIRIEVTPELTIEFHGPNVKARQTVEEQT